MDEKAAFFADVVDIPICTVTRDSRDNDQWLAAATDNYISSTITEVTADTVNDWVTDHVFDDNSDPLIGKWC